MGKSLQGFKVVSFESRMASAMERLIQKYGGHAMSAPAMQEVPLEHHHDVFHFAERLFKSEVDILICFTGVGIRTLLIALETRYERTRIVEALSKVKVVTRGPKPVRVLREYKIPIAIEVPEPNTWREVVQQLDACGKTLEHQTLAIQEYGQSNAAFVKAIQSRGARVLRVPVYRWAFPEDTQPLMRGLHAILDGAVQCALFTNKTQIDHLMRLANEEGLEEKLRQAFQRCVVCSIGPVCTEGLLACGVSVDMEPERSRIGDFVAEIAEEARELYEKKCRPQVLVKPKLYKPASQASLLVRTCRLEKTERTPIWLMRQAGRYMQAYRNIRRKRTFLDLCRDKDLVTQVTVEAQETLGVDAAIIFSDILLVLEAMGAHLEYTPGDGPLIQTTLAEGLNLPLVRPEEITARLNYVYESITQTRAALKPDIELIGFAGAPFTLVSYLIEGGPSRNFLRTKKLMYGNSKQWQQLMHQLSEAIIAHLVKQAKAGAGILQVFDSWVGCLSVDDYCTYVQPFSTRIFKALQGVAPTIHFGTGTSALLEEMCQAGGDVIGVDYRIGLDVAWQKIGFQRGVQGNLDPLVLCSDRTQIKKHALRIMREAGGRPGHIFNLGHGVLPQTPVENVRYLVDLIRNCKRTQSV